MHKAFRTVLFLTSLGLATSLLSGCNSKTSAQSADDMTQGNPKAKVTVIESASVACPVCAEFNAKVMPDFKKKYIDTGKINYVYKPMPTGNPAIAAAGELLARCAGKDKYFTVVEAIMRAQPQLYPNQRESGPDVDAAARPVLIGIAKSVGLSEADFDKCTQDDKALTALNAKFDTYLTKDKVNGTPTFFVNGKMINGVPQDIKGFDDAIEPQLK